MDLIIYHRDLDGLASALIAKKKYPNAELVSIQYSEENEFIEKYRDTVYDKVILVDFSFKHNLIDKYIKRMGKTFIWIDHHKTAAELPEWSDKTILGLRDITKAACQLTWDYFYPNEVTPYAIKLIADMDMWEFKYGDDTRIFIEHLQLYDINIDIVKINDIIFKQDVFIESIIDDNLILLEYKTAQVKKIYNKGHIITWEGYSCYICTTPIYLSDVGNLAVQNDEVDIAKISQKIWNSTKQEFVTVNMLISKKIDVSKIAKKHGGGGHVSAAGFTDS